MEESRKRHKLLVIDDDKSDRERLKKLLKLDDFDTLFAEDGRQGLDIFRKEKPEIALVDIKMAGMDGIEVLKKIKEESKHTEVIIITGYAGIDTAIEALREDAFSYLEKPIVYDKLEIDIRKALEKQEIQRRLDEHVRNLEEVNSELKSSNEKLKAANQELSASQQQLQSINQQLSASEQQLKAANQKLRVNEQRLEKAQEELREKISYLEEFSKFTVGRELKMIELKERIKELEAGLGEKGHPGEEI